MMQRAARSMRLVVPVARGSDAGLLIRVGPTITRRETSWQLSGSLPRWGADYKERGGIGTTAVRRGRDAHRAD